MVIVKLQMSLMPKATGIVTGTLVFGIGAVMNVLHRLMYNELQPHGSMAPASSPHDKQSCPSCLSLDLRAVTLNSVVVYIRCERCAHLWNIAERRKSPRQGEPRGF